MPKMAFSMDTNEGHAIHLLRVYFSLTGKFCCAILIGMFIEKFCSLQKTGDKALFNRAEANFDLEPAIRFDCYEASHM